MSTIDYDDSPIITVTTDHEGDTAVIHVSGEIDKSCVDSFVDSVADALDACPAGLVIDMSEVSFCGTVGLRVLVDARRGAATLDIGLCVVARNTAVLRIMQITGLDELFDIHDSVPTAVEALTAQR